MFLSYFLVKYYLMAKNQLIVFFGVPGTGKTTLAKEFGLRQENTALISFKSIVEFYKEKHKKKLSAELAFSHLEESVDLHLSRGENVIVDCALAKHKWRYSLQNIAEKWTCSVHWIYLTAPSQTCLKRLVKRNEGENWDFSKIVAFINKFDSVDFSSLEINTETLSKRQAVNKILKYITQ